jgi:Na+-driven multidrug efflux pump
MNSFGPYIYTGYTINNQIDSILYCVCSAFATACLTFTAQNYGAKNRKRIHKVLFYSILQEIVIGFILGFILLLMTKPLAMLFMPSNAENIELILNTTRDLNELLLLTYFLLGILIVLSGALRGVGYSVLQMILYIVGLCGTRVIWIYLVFPYLHTPVGLMLCYPASWIVSIIFLGTARLIAEKKLKKELPIIPDTAENL